jgi:thioredoxin reductase (NADPH)
MIQRRWLSGRHALSSMFPEMLHMTDNTVVSGNEVPTVGDTADVTIIGAGPTGLFAAFYATMRGASVRIIDSLEEPGGALTAIYPEKYIYDVGGFPKVLAKDLVEQLVEQAYSRGTPEMCLKEQVSGLERTDDGLIKLTTSHGLRFSKTVIVTAGVGAFEPKRHTAPGVSDLEGNGVHYFAKRIDTFRDRDVVIVGGGDSAVDWGVTLEPLAKSITLIHRSKFRAHESTVAELEASSATLYYPGYEVIGVSTRPDGHIASVTFKNAEGLESTIPCDELIVAIGFLADLGPLKTWGFELQRNQIVVDHTTMSTNIPGVFGAGDIVAYPAKFKLIANGFAEAITAVNHAVTFYDPSQRLDAGHSTNIVAKQEAAAAS